MFRFWSLHRLWINIYAAVTLIAASVKPVLDITTIIQYIKSKACVHGKNLLSLYPLIKCCMFQRITYCSKWYIYCILAVKPGQCVMQHTGNAMPPLWVRATRPIVAALSKAPFWFFFLFFCGRPAGGISRLINPQPTGESTAAKICIHLSQQSGQSEERAEREGGTHKWHSCPHKHILLIHMEDR